MPGGDRTGPLGMGPMTGRGAGFCAGYGMPGWTNPIPGRGAFGFGRRGFAGRGFGGGGRGRGFRHWYYATGLPGWARAGYYPGFSGYQPPYGPAEMTRDEELAVLREQAQYMEKAIEDVRKRIGELEARTGDE